MSSTTSQLSCSGDSLRPSGEHVPRPARYRITLPRDPKSAGLARRYVASVAAGHPCLGDVQLIASELVANAAAHGLSAEFPLDLEVSDEGVLVTVTNLSKNKPHVIPTSAENECGRGLFIIDNMALLEIRYNDATTVATVSAFVSEGELS